MKQFGMNDPLNLRDYIFTFTSFFKDNSDDNEPQSARGFFVILLDGITPFQLRVDEIKGTKTEKTFKPKVGDFQKLLSGNMPIERLQPFITRLLDGYFDTIFLNNISIMVNTALCIDSSGQIFTSLYNSIIPRFFTKEELEGLSSCFNNKHYSEFLLRLLKHGFLTAHNIPAFYGARVYDQALTFDFDSPVRFSLMKEAADNGVAAACIEYGNYLARRSKYDTPLTEEEKPVFSEALHYFMQASNYPPALWNIAFFLENGYISAVDYRVIVQALNIESKLTSDEYCAYINELDSVISADTNMEQEAIMLAYRIHFYLAYGTNAFYKSFNSMAKLLLSGKVVLTPNSGLSLDDLVTKYRSMGVNAGDIISIYNEGCRLLSQLQAEEKPSKEMVSYISDLIQIAMNAGFSRGYYNYALLHECLRKKGFDNSKSLGEIKELYLKAAKLCEDNSPVKADIYYRLGDLSHNISEQGNYYALSVHNGGNEAAYSLALIWYKQYLTNKDKTHLILDAYQLLSKSFPYMKKNKNEATLLMKVLQSSISENL